MGEDAAEETSPSSAVVICGVVVPAQLPRLGSQLAWTWRGLGCSHHDHPRPAAVTVGFQLPTRPGLTGWAHGSSRACHRRSRPRLKPRRRQLLPGHPYAGPAVGADRYRPRRRWTPCSPARWPRVTTTSMSTRFCQPNGGCCQSSPVHGPGSPCHRRVLTEHRHTPIACIMPRRGPSTRRRAFDALVSVGGQRR
jgi:hypothetical protein